MTVSNNLVGCVAGGTVTLVCSVEAYPKPINYWMRHRVGRDGDGDFIMNR